MVYRSCPVCSAEYGKTGPETLDFLRHRVKELEEQKKILFEQNGKLLAERESGQWDANWEEIKQLSQMNSDGCDLLAKAYEERDRLRKVVDAARNFSDGSACNCGDCWPCEMIVGSIRELDHPKAGE